MSSLGNVLYEFAVKIKMDSEDLDTGLGKLNNKINGVLGGVAKAGAAALAAGVAGVTVLTKQSVAAYAEYEQMVGGVQKLFGNMGMSLQEYARQQGKSMREVQSEWQQLEDAQNLVIQNAKNAYRTAGMDMNTYLNTATSMSAKLIQDLGGDSKKAAEVVDKAMMAISDNWNTFGGDLGMIQNAFQGFMRGNYMMLDNLKLGYGGTRAEMERLIDDANEYARSIGKAGDLTISNFADIVEAIDLIQQKQNIAGTTAREATETVAGSLNMLKAAWQNLLIGFSDPDADLGTYINNVIESAKITAENLLPVIGQAISGIGQLIREAAPVIAKELPGIAQKVLPDLIAAAAELVKGLIAALPGLVSGIGQALKEIVPTIFDGLSEQMPALSGLFDALSKALEGVFGWVADHGETVVTILGSILAAFLAFKVLIGLFGAISTAMSLLGVSATITLGPIILLAAAIAAIVAGVLGLRQAMSEGWDSIPKWFEIALKAIVPGADALVQANQNAQNELDLTKQKLRELEGESPHVRTAYEDMATASIETSAAMGTAFLNAGQTIRDAFSGLKTAGSDMKNSLSETANILSANFSSAAQRVKDAMGSIASKAIEIGQTIKTAFSTAIDAVKALPGQMLAIGRQILEGLWNGISDKIAWLKEKVQGVVETIKGWFTGKDGFDEHSPSKWARKVFENVIIGGGEGLEDGFPNVFDAAKSGIQQLKENLMFEPDTFDIQNAVNVSIGNSGLHGSTNYNNDIVVNVYPSDNQDPRAIADEIERRIVNKKVRLGAVYA